MVRTNHNILSNNKQSDEYERRLEVEKLRPIGREIFNTYKHVRVDERTVILKKVRPNG